MQVSRKWLLAGVVVFAGAATANAQQAPAQNSTPGGAANASTHTGDHAQVAISHVLPGHKINGLHVFNREGQKIGEIQDMVVDLRSGKVAYAALDHGHKLIAVPWHSLVFHFGKPNDADARFFTLNATKEQLDSAQGFDKDHWPNLNAQWATSVNRHFGVQEETPTSGQNQPAVAYETMFRVHQLDGMDVNDPQGQKIGDVQDVAIDVNRGMVAYLALQYGHWYSGGSKLFAIPLSAFTLAHSGNKTYLTLGLNQDALKNAPGFDKDHWPSHADQRFLTEMNSYYERHARANTNNAAGNRQ
jgi:sporulation protein YlmC with PRC-barrel domain